MKDIRIATAQFETKSGDKEYNLGIIERLSTEAAARGAQIVAFHECSITGLTHALHLSMEQMTDLAEFIPDGPSIDRLQKIALKQHVAILAGLFEKDADGNLYKAHICVDKHGLVAKFRKLHPFINPHISPGNQYCVFELFGWRCGILICYDNNIVENVRATNLLGADILFMPHVTMCTPSTRPGAGYVNPLLWQNREKDPTSLRIEFDGLKGREWLMKWLPSRAYDNGMYVVFSNAIGMEADQLKNGCSMILDPFGDIIAECRTLGNAIEVALCSSSKLIDSGGYRYKMARKPSLYGEILSSVNESRQLVSWKDASQK